MRNPNTRLKALREAVGFSIAELAEYTGLSWGTISGIEKGTSEYRTQVDGAIILARTFGCEVWDIFEKDDVSPLGRPALTGTPINSFAITIRTVSNGVVNTYDFSHTREHFCTSCNLAMPLKTGICETCI